MKFYTCKNFWSFLSQILWFFWKKLPKCKNNFQKILEAARLLYVVQVGSQIYIRIFFPFFVSSQIWLNWLVDDCQLNYITKFNRKTLLESGTDNSKPPATSFFSFLFLLGVKFRQNEKYKNKKGIFCHNRVILKVRRSGGENGQFRHNRASNSELGAKSLQKEITETQTSFSTNFGSKLSFILCFLFPERLHCSTYIFTAPTCTTTIITLEPCALNTFIPKFNKISLLCGYHCKRG